MIWTFWHLNYSVLKQITIRQFCSTLENLLKNCRAFVVLYSSFVAPYYMKWLRNIQIIRIIRIIFRYSNIRIMIFKLWILFVIRFGHFLPMNIIQLFDSLQNDYSWQHCVCVCGGREAFLVMLLKCCCCCSIIINYFHITPVEQWKYNMCDVCAAAMHGCALATLVSAVLRW